MIEDFLRVRHFRNNTKNSFRQTTVRFIRGILVPPCFESTITGIYRHVVNLSVEDERGPYLLSLVADPKDWTELALMVGPPLLSRIAAEGIGASLTLESSGDLRLATAQGCAPAPPVINPADGRAPPPAPPPLRRSRDLPLPPSGALAACSAALLERYHDRGFVALLSDERGASPFVRRAATLLESRGAAALVGLGPGLTPAGDDFLSGMMLAEDLGAATYRQDGAGPHPVAATPLHRPLDRGRIGAALRRTTPAGASLLRLALAGYPPTYQILLVEALAAGHGDHAIAIATAHGHSSGLDALAGFLFVFDTRPATV